MYNDLSKILFSNSAKVALVRPVFRQNDRTDTQNYKPVNVLNCFSKNEKFIDK